MLMGDRLIWPLAVLLVATYACRAPLPVTCVDRATAVKTCDQWTRTGVSDLPEYCTDSGDVSPTFDNWCTSEGSE